MIKTPTGRRQLFGYLQAWPKIWSRDWPRTNPASGRNRTRTRDRRMASPTRRPLGHAASLNCLEGVFLPCRFDVPFNLSYLLTILSRNKVLFKRFGYFLCSVKSSIVKCLFNVLCCFYRYPCCTTVGVWVGWTPLSLTCIAFLEHRQK